MAVYRSFPGDGWFSIITDGWEDTLKRGHAFQETIKSASTNQPPHSSALSLKSRGIKLKVVFSFLNETTESYSTFQLFMLEKSISSNALNMAFPRLNSLRLKYFTASWERDTRLARRPIQKRLDQDVMAAVFSTGVSLLRLFIARFARLHRDRSKYSHMNTWLNMQIKHAVLIRSVFVFSCLMFCFALPVFVLFLLPVLKFFPSFVCYVILPCPSAFLCPFIVFESFVWL